MSDIFVSYAREDRAHAERLARALESRKWSVWWDRSIPTGKAFDEVIEEAIDEARCVIVLWSERSAASRWVRTEAEEGAKREILVPIRIEDVEIPLAFRGIQTADLIGWDGAPGSPEIEALVGDIAALIGPSPAGVEGTERQAEVTARRPAAPKAVRRVEAEAGRKGGAARSRLHGYVFMAIAAVVVALGLLALLGRLGDSSPGFWMSSGGVVMRVFSGGAAEQAGMEVGDVVRQVNGIPVEDWDWSAPRKIGETVAFGVERAGMAVELPLTYAELPTALKMRAMLSFVVGLAILWFCLWGYNETLSTTSALLALFGLSFSIAFLGLPADPGMQAEWMGKLVNVLVTLSLAFLVHFLMLYPKRSSLLDKFGFGAQPSVYFPAFVLALAHVLGGDFDDALQWVNLVVWIGYFAWALVYLILSFVRATSRERSQQGLNLMLAGVILGLLPPTVALFANVFFPMIVLPGVEFYALALVLIPTTCAIAAVRGYKATVAARRR